MDFIINNAIKQQQSEPEFDVGQANIKVIGVGGGGSNMINWLYKKGIREQK